MMIASTGTVQCTVYDCCLCERKRRIIVPSSIVVKKDTVQYL